MDLFIMVIIFIGVLAALLVIIAAGIKVEVHQNVCGYCGEPAGSDHYCDEKLRIIRNAQRRGVYEYGSPIIRVVVHCTCGRTHEGVPIVPRSKVAHDKTVHIYVDHCMDCFGWYYGSFTTYPKNFKDVVMV